jgi:DNA polymerase-3 subunit delta'
MTHAAANSILKMLEEPPPGWIFILTAADASRLLPTILSRCLEVRLRPLSAGTIFQILKETQGLDFNSTRAEVASRGGMGSIRRAQSFLDPETWEMREQILGLLSNPAQDWLKFVENLASSQRMMSLGLDLLESIFHDCLMDQISAQHPPSNQKWSHTWIHQDQQAFLKQWLNAKHFKINDLESILDRIAENRKLVPLTLNSKLLAQQTLIPLLESIL